MAAMFFSAFGRFAEALFVVSRFRRGKGGTGTDAATACVDKIEKMLSLEMFEGCRIVLMKTTSNFFGKPQDFFPECSNFRMIFSEKSPMS